MAAAHAAVHRNREKRQHKEGPENDLSQLADHRRRRSSAGSDLLNVYTANDMWEEGKGETFGQVLNHSQPTTVYSFWPHVRLEC